MLKRFLNMTQLAQAFACSLIFSIFSAKPAIAETGIEAELTKDINEELMKADLQESSSGLPQFDISTFPSQLLWLTIAFAILYFAFNNKFLPEISKILEERKELIDNDLETAEKLKAEAESMQRKYEAQLMNARNEANAKIKQASDEATKIADKQLALFQTKAEREVKKMFDQAEGSKQEILHNSNEIITEIVIENVRKLSGIEIDKKEAMAAVNSLIEQQAKAA